MDTAKCEAPVSVTHHPTAQFSSAFPAKCRLRCFMHVSLSPGPLSLSPRLLSLLQGLIYYISKCFLKFRLYVDPNTSRFMQHFYVLMYTVKPLILVILLNWRLKPPKLKGRPKLKTFQELHFLFLIQLKISPTVLTKLCSFQVFLIF